MIELACLAHRELEDLFGTGRIRNVVAPVCSLALLDGLLDLVPDVFEVSVQILQDGTRHTVTLTNDPEQDVLGSDELLMEARRLLPRHLEDFARAIREVVTVQSTPADPVANLVSPEVNNTGGYVMCQWEWYKEAGDGRVGGGPTSPAASSLRMSPNMFSVRRTSNAAGSATSFIAAKSTYRCSRRTSG